MSMVKRKKIRWGMGVNLIPSYPIIYYHHTTQKQKESIKNTDMKKTDKENCFCSNTTGFSKERQP